MQHKPNIFSLITWFCSIGPLINYIDHRSIYDARLNGNESIADMIKEGEWDWPDEWSYKFPFLNTIQVPKLCNKPDSILWRDKNMRCSSFRIKEVWKCMRIDYPSVDWYKVVWFSQCNPRMAFILWMAIKGRLQTHDRVMKWNNDPNMKCPLCKKVSDSHRHLFFECEYSGDVWKMLKDKLEIMWMSNSWSTIIEQYANDTCNSSIGSVLKRIGLATCVYHLWKEEMQVFSLEMRLESQTC